MKVFLRFTVAAVLVFLFADIIPFPNYPSGYIVTQLNQHNTINDNDDN